MNTVAKAAAQNRAKERASDVCEKNREHEPNSLAPARAGNTKNPQRSLFEMPNT